MSAAAAERPAQAGRWAAPALLFALLVFLVYSGPLCSRAVFTGRDQLAYNLPMAKSIHDAYARGRLPVWTPEVSGGRPLLPNPNVGALYPLRPLLALLPFPLAMRLYPLLHWAAAGVGTIVLLLSLGCSTPAAWVGAVTYVFSGVGVSEAFFPHLQPGMTLLPWVIWRARGLALGGTRAVLWLSVLFALELLAADVFTVGLAILCAVLWIVFEPGRLSRGGLFLRLAAALVLGAAAAAPQIVATALWVPGTNRAVIGMNLADATRYSLSPLRLLEFLIPYPFGGTWQLESASVWGRRAFGGKAFGFFTTLYCGALVLLSLPAAWKARLQGARFARALMVVGAVGAILPGLAPAGWGSLRSPLPLRNPEKLAVALVLAAAMMAALAMEVFLRERKRPAGGLLVAVLLAAAAGACALWPQRAGRFAAEALGESALAGSAAEQLPFALAEAGLFWILTVAALETIRASGRPARLAGCALLTLVPVAASRRIPQVSREEETFAPTAFALRVRREDPSGSYRTLGESLYRPLSAEQRAHAVSELGSLELSRSSWTESTQVLWSRGTVFNEDFDSGDLARVESLRRVSALAAGFRDSAAFFGNLALRWGVRYKGQDAVAGFRRIGGDLAQEWDEHERAFPDIRLATQWSEQPDSLAALRQLPRLASGQVVIETGRPAEGAARPGRVRVLEKSPELLRLDLEAPDPTWLFVLRAYWNHRAVAIDGREAETFPADLAFSAVRIPAGRHRLEWRERVPGLTVSRWGPVAFGAVAAGLWIAESRRRTA